MQTKDLIAKLDKYLKDQPFGGIIRRSEMPELIEIAPDCGGRHKVGQYTITRSKVDQLDQFTITKPLPTRSRCPVCGMRLDADGSCWWCKNPE